MRNIISILLIFMAMAVNARQIMPDEAQAIATEFFNGAIASKTLPQRTACLANNVSSHKSTAEPYYIFNASDSKGFVIISGDTRAKKILGYSDKGSFNPNSIPPQLAWLLGEYKKQLESVDVSAPQDASWESNEISSEAVLLQTANWGQSSPYNSLCPIANNGLQSVTGCVATAMAIIMKYYNYPEKGTRSHKYRQKNPDISDDYLECDFENTIFQWDLIENVVNDASSEATKQAVATLMRSVAISLNSFFGHGGTGANVLTVVGALRDYFQYDYSCQALAKNTFSDEEWKNLIYQQIDNNHPIIYSGYLAEDVSNGHAWVLDGYNKDADLFHFNWGWDGKFNGFYSLSSTSADDLKLYPNEQKMIINICPKEKGWDNYSRSYVEYPHQFANYDPNVIGGLTLTHANVERGKLFDAMINRIVIPPHTSCEVGLALMSETNIAKEIISNTRVQNQEDDWIHMAVPIRNCVFNSEIMPNDYIQLVEKSADNSDYKLITGSINAHSYIPVVGNKPNAVEIKIESNKDVVLKLSGISGVEFKEFHNNDVLHVAPSTEVHFEIIPVEDKPNSGIIYSVYDCFRRFNQVDITESEPNKIRGIFKVNSESTIFKVEYVELAAPLTLNLATSRSLREIIDEKAARLISSLTLSGNINAQDIWYIGEYFQSLSSINLKDAIIEESMNEYIPDFGDYIPALQERNKMPEYSFWGMKRLKSIILPESLEILGTASLSGCNLSSLRIPKSVRVMYAWIANSNEHFSKVYCSSPNPPEIYSIPLFVGTNCFKDGTLFVPKGSIESYKKAPYVWNDFPHILEEVLIQSIKLTPSNVNGAVGVEHQLTVTVNPETATDKSIVWSCDNPEVVTVDDKGVLKLLKQGTATITATASDGSGVQAQCMVIVDDNSGIESIIDKPDTYVKIYNISGVLVYEGVYSEANLAKGIYIALTQDGKSERFIK